MPNPDDDDDGSKFNLSDELRLLAQTELREDEATRQHALQQMREWIQKHPDIKCCRTGMKSKMQVFALTDSALYYDAEVQKDGKTAIIQKEL